MKLLNQYEINTLNAEGIEYLFNIFKKDFIDNKTYLVKGTDSLEIDINEEETCPCPHGNEEKPERFWHVITNTKKTSVKAKNPCLDPKEAERSYDKARAKRIHWIKILIDNWQTDSNLSHFYQTRSGQKNLIIWERKENFLIIIRKIRNDNTRFLVSSYIVYDEEAEYRYKKQLKRYDKNKPTGEEWF